MQLLQLFIGATTISVAVWRAPFTLFQKLLFVFGYFILYEYGVLTRSYGLGAMLLVITLAVAATNGRRRWPVIGALLGLMALTSAFGALVAIAVLLGLGADEWLRRRADDGATAAPGAVVLGAALTLTGLVVAYVQAGRTPNDTGSYNHWRTNIDVGLGASSTSSVWRALVPIPSLEREYWNTNIVSARAAVVGALGLVLFVIVAWVLRDRPGSFVVWVGGVVLIVGFLYAHRNRDRVAPHRPRLPLPRRGDVARTIYIVAFSLSSARDFGAVLALPVRPLRSAARAVTRVDGVARRAVDRRRLRRGARSRVPVLERPRRRAVHPAAPARRPPDHRLPDTAASTVAGYLDRPIYYLAGSRSGTFVVWSKARNTVQPIDAVIRTQPPFTGPRALVLGQPSARRPQPAPAVARALRQRDRARRALLALRRHRAHGLTRSLQGLRTARASRSVPKPVRMAR